MTTDGPVVLLELAHQLHEDWPRVARALRNLAAAWEAERAQAAGRAAYLEPGHSCAGDPVCVVCALRSEVDKLRAQAAADRAARAQARALAEQEMARAERAEEQAFHVTMETYRTGLVGDAFRFMQYWQERSLKQSAAARKVAQAYRKVAADGEHDFWTEHNRAETMKAERDACEEENDDLRDEIRIYEAQESELERALAAALSGGAR